MVKVWFNHWFSTSYRLIELMKADREEKIYVIGTNRQINSVIGNVCDEWYEELDFDGEEYIDYCINFCRKHEINVFVPRRKMVDISKNKDRFSDIGVKVMVDDYSIIKLLNDKSATYEYFKKIGGIHIPDYYSVNTSDEFVQAYNKLKEKYDRVCVKFVKDEGGMSFRKITDEADLFKKLRIYAGTEVLLDDYANALRLGEPFDDLMVMPYLSGNEISVDCLSTPNGLIAVPRDKGNARHERVYYDDEILKMINVIMRETRLEYPCNIQFKYMNNMPYLLEINTRMSGGLQMSCLAADVNIPNIALNKLLGKAVSWTQNKDEKTVSYIELPQIIESMED